MKVSKNCGIASGCWSTSPLLHVVGDEIEDNSYQAYSGAYFVILADGTALFLDVWIYSSFSYARIRVDIDGPNKGKTQEGSDIFDFTIYGKNSYGQIPYQLTPSSCPNSWIGNDVIGYTTAWVIQNGNLDYLKCADKLNWQTKTSCK